MTKEKKLYVVADKNLIFITVPFSLKDSKEVREEHDKRYPDDAPHRIYKLTEVER